MSSPTVNFFIQTRQVQFAVPNELIKKNLKAVQKLVEKARKLLLEEIGKVRKSTMSPEQKLASVRKLMRQFEQTQRKLKVLIDHDTDYRSRLAARAARLSQLREFTIKVKKSSEESEKDDELELDFHSEDFIGWLRDEANVLIIDYLLKSNMSNGRNVGAVVAEKINSIGQTSIKKLLDCDVYENYNRVFLSIVESHDLELITSWYNDNRNALKKIGLNLQFEIHYCRFLYLLNQEEVFEAIDYSKQYLAPYARKLSYSPEEEINFEANLERLSEVGAPLTYSASIFTGKLNPNSIGSLLLYNASDARHSKSSSGSRKQTEQRWSRLAECFTKDYTRTFGISQNYPLLIYLSAGLSCLKTKLCYCNESNSIFNETATAKSSKGFTNGIGKGRSSKDLLFRGPNYYYSKLKKTNQCPVCSPELYAMSRSLPYGLLITSIFNDPMMLPNGNIYPFEKLAKNVGVQQNSTRDPLTEEIFPLEDCVRVFPA